MFSPISNKYISLKPAFLLSVMLLVSCGTEKAKPVPDRGLLSEIEVSLDTLVEIWYPKTVDNSNGGFWSDFDYKWEKEGPQNKMLVSQARHIWTASTLALFYKDKKYEEIAAHGYRFLRDVMWDGTNGGFHTLLHVKNDSSRILSKTKSTYGNSFAIYGLATYYKASKDTAALNLAKKTFLWLEEHAHDPIHKGYFDVLQLDGSWFLDVKTNDADYDNFVRKDWKDQNSSIHLLESFTALYEVWRNPLLKERLEEMLGLIRDTITTPKGHLNLYLERDWKPISLQDSTDAYRKQNLWMDHVSFGHDVETAFLMLEASHILGRKKDSITLGKAKNMVDHALEWGWDRESGGFYYEGAYWDKVGRRTIENEAKVWWTQAEGLNSLLLFSKLFPDESRYLELFEKQWDHIITHMIDYEYGGWFHEGLDTNPEAKYDAKAHNWKVNYHNIRALVNTIQMLKGEFPLTDTKH
ncbi:AGE family epimerase/isomerase [Ulvibacterium sp.]|uniref:AGE family epimerase/isomerase n=1 Tax=Ulvibacterium sp. TaxID=2665914 RepID=UPI00261CE144|nr:AGE family epimerase/isomerase [Ulvibacterium sp.]